MPCFTTASVGLNLVIGLTVPPPTCLIRRAPDAAAALVRDTTPPEASGSAVSDAWPTSPSSSMGAALGDSDRLRLKRWLRLPRCLLLAELCSYTVRILDRLPGGVIVVAAAPRDMTNCSWPPALPPVSCAARAFSLPRMACAVPDDLLWLPWVPNLAALGAGCSHQQPRTTTRTGTLSGTAGVTRPVASSEAMYVRCGPAEGVAAFAWFSLEGCRCCGCVDDDGWM